VASAATINESADFSNTLAGALTAPLPVGTTAVTGALSPFSDVDYVDFQGLLAGGAYTLQLVSPSGFLNFDDFDSSGNHVGSAAGGASFQTPFSITGTIPTDGQLVAKVTNSEGSSYTINLTAQLAPSAPEPVTSGLVGLGLAAVGLLGARRRKQSL